MASLNYIVRTCLKKIPQNQKQRIKQKKEEEEREGKKEDSFGSIQKQ
jgi:hypothetical protein